MITRILLIVGGVFQALASALHVAMFFGISRAPEIPGALKPLLYIFNAAVLALVLFLAYVSFFRMADLIQTRLGRATCLFIGAFYLQRGLVEAFVRGFSPGSMGLFCLIAAPYLVTAFIRRPPEVEIAQEL